MDRQGQRRLVRAVILACSIVLPTGSAMAQSYDGDRRAKARKAKPAPVRVYDDNSRWYPNNADKLKIGSRIWWDQMQREGRIGGGGSPFRR